MVTPKVKTIKTNYLVKVNNELSETFDSLREARRFIKTLVINDDLHIVQIIKQTINESLLATYESKVTRVLTVTELDKGLEQEGEENGN